MTGRMGADAGNLCHSATQMQRLRGAFAEAILEVVTDHVEKNTMCRSRRENVTVDKRTIDINGIIT